MIPCAPQKPAVASGGKARKRQRDGEGVTGPSKKGKEGGVSEPEAASAGEEGEQQLVKTGFFSTVKFSDLPLSDVMFAALAKLNFTTTTKIQVSKALQAV